MIFNLFKKKTKSISPMEGDHLFEVAQIHKSSFTHSWNDGAIAELLKQTGTKGLVAHTGNKINAFIIYRNVATESEVITIATSPKQRRAGAARLLMEEYIRLCLSDRLEEIFLEVDEDNVAATKLYSSLGFKKVGERKGYFNRGSINEGTSASAAAGNALIMRLDLNA